MLAAVIVLFIVVGAFSDKPKSKNAADASASSSTTVRTAAPSTPATASSTSASSSSSRPVVAPVSQVAADRKQAGKTAATVLLATLRIKGRAAKAGYSRAQFGSAWTDDNGAPGGHNGCDTRNDVLRRDLTGVSIKANSNGCTVLTGTLRDPYTGRTIHFLRGEVTSNAVQIDHVVALSDAWQTGAQQWSANVRVDLANDPLNLLAVDGPSNEAKGDGDAATWLPPNKSYRCAYVARQIAVKARYHLWITSAEHDAMTRVLATCPTVKAPAEGGTPPRSTTTTAAPHTSSPRPHPSKTTQPPVETVKVYANCDELNQDYPHGVGRPGASDHTSSGNPVTNFTIDAAVYDANTGRDRDGDGIACEQH